MLPLDLCIVDAHVYGPHSNEYYCLPGRATTLLDLDYIVKRAPQVAMYCDSSVNGLAIDTSDDEFYVFQITGYSQEKGLYCYLLDKDGNIVG